MGKVLGKMGDVFSALMAFREAEALSRRLVEAARSNASWQRDLSQFLVNRAQLLEAIGEASQALPLAEETLVIAERLAALDRSNAVWQNDLAICRAAVDSLRGNSAA